MAANLAAWHSSASRSSNRCRTSSGEISETVYVLPLPITHRPSAPSRRNASRNGVRDTPRRAACSTSPSAVPGAKRPDTMSSRRRRYARSLASMPSQQASSPQMYTSLQLFIVATKQSLKDEYNARGGERGSGHRIFWLAQGGAPRANVPYTLGRLRGPDGRRVTDCQPG